MNSPSPVESADARPRSPRAEHPRVDRAIVVAGGIVLLAGLAVLGRLVAWFVVDEGWVAVGGDESELHRPLVALVSMVPSVFAVAFGARLLVRARRAPSPSGLRLLAALALATVIAAFIGMQWYPQSSRAAVVALHPRTGQPIWRAVTPATELFGVRSQNEREVEIEGRIDHRGCRFDIVAITVDRSTGDVARVRELPTWYPDAESLPPRPTPPSASEYRFEQGRAAVVCRS